MTPQELKDKIIQAKAIGTPIFLLEDEIRWLRDLMLEIADDLSDRRLDDEDKIDFIRCVGIGTKCENELRDDFHQSTD